MRGSGVPTSLVFESVVHGELMVRGQMLLYRMFDALPVTEQTEEDS